MTEDSDSPKPRTGLRQAMWRRLRGGGRDERGAAAVFFAVALLLLAPMMLGLADLYLGASQRSRLQDALDAATLFAGRSTASTTAAVDTIGDRALLANYAAPAGVTLVASTFTLDGQTVQGYAEATPVALAPGLWPHNNVKVYSTVVRSQDKLEIALVLDNTGSMRGTKLTNTVTAAKNLIDTLVTATSTSTVPNILRISLVPFSSTVRVQSTTSLTSYNTSTKTGPGIPTWLDPEANAHVDARTDIFNAKSDRFALMKAMGLSWAGCVESRQQPYDIQETAPTSGTAATMFVPYFYPDEPDEDDGFDHFYNDYLDDDTNSNNWWVRQRKKSKYDTSPRRGMAGPNQDCDMLPLIRLTTSTSTVKDSIDDMVATGSTNVPMGLVWGWHTLSPNAPFADGAAYGTANTRKIIVLMTDGDNTYSETWNENESYYEGLGYIWQNLLGITSGSSSTRTTKMNERFTALCGNIKNRNIIIYTVGVQVSDSSKTLLQNCATSSSYYYNVTSASDLNAAFQAIAASIDNLRLSR